MYQDIRHKEESVKKYVIFMLLVAMVSGAFAGGTSESTASQETAEKIILKIGNNQPTTHPWNAGINDLIRLAAEYSGGVIEIVNYPNAMLGTEPQLLESVKQGSLDMCVLDPTVGTTFSKELELFALPFLFRDYDHWLKALDGEPGRKYSDLIENKSGLRILGYWGGSTRNVISVRKTVRSIDDLKGYKLRLAASELKFNVWKAVGTLPVSVAFGETYSALASGLVDGMENEMPSILANKFYEPAPNFTMTGHEITVRPIFINATKLATLEPNIRSALIKAVNEATVLARKYEKDFGEAAQKEMVEKYGIKIFTIDKQPIMDSTAAVFKQFGENTGLTELINEIKAVK